MTEQQLTKIKFYLTLLVSLTAWGTLIWQHTHQGVASHYLLHRSDLPAISNWWGGVLLPLLTWGLMTLASKKAQATEQTSSSNIIYPLLLAFVYGAVIAACFKLGYSAVSAVMFWGLLFISLFYKIYRAEFLLGFVLSMSVVFGAVLPTLFGVIITTLGFVIYQVSHWLIQRLKGRKLAHNS